MRVPDPPATAASVRERRRRASPGIVEDRDASPSSAAIDEVNSGVCAFDYPALEQVLVALTAHNARGSTT